MAVRYFGISLGDNKQGVAEGSSTTSKPVEVAVDMAVFTQAHDVLKALELIADRIKEGNWLPA